MSARVFAGLCAAALLAGCTELPVPSVGGLSSFDLIVSGVYTPGTPRAPLGVVSTCVAKYGSQAAVPAEVRGTDACRYLLPRGEVEVDVVGAAKDHRGAPVKLDGPVSFRVTPGDLAGEYKYRWAKMTGGALTGTVRVAHVYGEVQIWAEDAPVKIDFADGGIGGDKSQLPEEPAHRTWATGLSPTVFFEEPTLAKVQIPDGFDNRSSPLVGQFLTIGRNPESGGVVRQSCANDPKNDGQPATLVVTGIDPGGFFVTDLTACRLKEDTVDPATGQTVVRAPEPDGMLPGTFGAMYIYNYSYPDGLYAGDLLWTLSGSVQEFTSTTQLTFPAWSIREKVRQLPVAEWEKWLKLAVPYELSLRTCGIENSAAPFLTDTLCGHNRRNLKMESLESALVRVHRAKFPVQFKQCDFNGDGTVPFFCESNESDVGWLWRDCAFERARPDCSAPKTDEERELCCNIECTTRQGTADRSICAERSTFTGFGQYVMELPSAGAPEDGRDTSLPAKSATLMLTAATSTRVSVDLPLLAEMHLWCSAPVHYKFGNATVTAVDTDPTLPAGGSIEHSLVAGEARLAVLPSASVTAADRCVISANTHTRINVITKDAVPDLQPDCSEDDPDAARAEQCKRLRAATYDVTGHLRHLQPGRPRWMIIPRDQDDICCRPGPGMECPKPLKRCL